MRFRNVADVNPAVRADDSLFVLLGILVEYVVQLMV